VALSENSLWQNRASLNLALSTKISPLFLSLLFSPHFPLSCASKYRIDDSSYVSVYSIKFSLFLSISCISIGLDALRATHLAPVDEALVYPEHLEFGPIYLLHITPYILGFPSFSTSNSLVFRFANLQNLLGR
jgi:hypothetical protein